MEEIVEGVDSMNLGSDSYKRIGFRSPTPRNLCSSMSNLAKRYMQQPDVVELSALGMAIATVVTVAEILKNNGLAVEKKITTSTVDIKDDSRGRPVQKAKILKDGLSAVHVPYAYGFAIILLTVLVKAATFPLTKKQVESAMAMRSLQPQVKAVQQRYAGIRMPTHIGNNSCMDWTVQSSFKCGQRGSPHGRLFLDTLSGWSNHNCFSTKWERANSYIMVASTYEQDGRPPLGWSDTFAYLVLPVLLVVSQYISVQIMQSSQNNDPNMKSSQAISKFLPLMIGYFALSVPSGLSLYWLTNNILSTAQQAWLQKLGGAKNPDKQLIDEIMKQEQPQIQRQVPKLDATSSSTVARQEEKLTAEGLKPGERFKQIKEQEARLRRQSEEEKRNAEEAADKSAIVGVGVNGSLSRTDVKEDQGSISMSTMQRTDVENKPSATPGEGVHETYTGVAKDAKLKGEEQREKGNCFDQLDTVKKTPSEVVFELLFPDGQLSFRVYSSIIDLDWE
ncbi:ALBINO3-like protein 1, chloroplastic, partial [Cucurbita argyrosperma subsp. sororia]